MLYECPGFKLAMLLWFLCLWRSAHSNFSQSLVFHRLIQSLIHQFLLLSPLNLINDMINQLNNRILQSLLTLLPLNVTNQTTEYLILLATSWTAILVQVISAVGEIVSIHAGEDPVVDGVQVDLGYAGA